MERETNPIERDKDKKEKEIPISDIDRMSFKFVEWTRSEGFTYFVEWLDEIKRRMNRVDYVMPIIELTGKNELENFGLKTLTIRAKISMLDEIVLLIRSAQVKYDKLNKEKKNG